MPKYKFVRKANEDVVHVMKESGLRTLCGHWSVIGYADVHEGVVPFCMCCIAKLAERTPGLWAAISVDVKEIES